MNRHSQQGSALLIVLGFLSFMVVSAVAFAIWMRNERLPSSAPRRSVASRYLVKAALAQAMSRVDDAVRSHPYPGAWCTNMNNQSTAYRDGQDCPYDWWESRVFMPPDPQGIGTTSGDPFSRYAPVTKTVSVLNLEALGYLPPSIVNDVRLLSRSSWAAQWEYFNFDAGRYAFCAVNVSDMLDINKLAGNASRTSAAAGRTTSSNGKPPASRFSLAYLFRNGDEPSNFSNPTISDCRAFDEFVHTSRPSPSDNPLVSLLDYNLALGEGSRGSLYSPFLRFIRGSTRGGFYGGDAETPLGRSARRQPFVTDSWFPPSDYEEKRKKANRLVDITEFQPFRNGETRNLNESNSGKTLDRARSSALAAGKFWEQIDGNGHAFCPLDYYTLFDYLDEDSLPLSLAMPCAERVPMITSIGFKKTDGVEVTFSKPEEREETKGNEVWKYHDVKISVKVPDLSVALMFPFKSGSGIGAGSYKVEAFTRLVFVDEGDNAENRTVTRLRDVDAAGNRNENMKFAHNFRPVGSDWSNSDEQYKLKERGGTYNREAVQKCLLRTSYANDSWDPPNKNDDVRIVDDLYDNGVQLRSGDDPGELALSKIEVYEKVKESPEAEAQLKLKETRYQINLNPFDSQGRQVPLDTPIIETEGASAFDAFCDKHNIRPYLLAWVRVMDAKGDTVDMAPAMLFDDNELNKVNNVGAGFVEAWGSEAAEPMFAFPSKMTFTFKNAKVALDSNSDQPVPRPADGEWLYRAFYAVDPRYNWAPENWIVPGDESKDPIVKDWYELVFKSGGALDALAKDISTENPRADRARDPFLFVSNLGYLQSVGELAFLPRSSEIANNTMSEPELKDLTRYNGLPRALDTVGSMPCAETAWKSYQNYRTNPEAFEFGANLYRRGLVNSQGFYINPFTQSKEIMLAAFANTPANYWMAGTNDNADVKRDQTARTQFTKEVSDGSRNRPAIFEADQYNEYSANRLAEYMQHRFEDLANMLRIPGASLVRNDAGRRSYMIQKVWEDMFDALDWGGRMDHNTRVSDIYRDLNTYLASGRGKASSYKDMYTKDNSYGALNDLVTEGEAPGISLDLDRATHDDEYADPMYYFCNAKTSLQDLRDPSKDSYISDVDRMFLHSYWRDCFANRQQLFLIFVRAESTALGGTGEGTPAQQGGRAVALVWRDPEAPAESSYADDRESEVNSIVKEENNRLYTDRHPHRMRILFYRQLD